MRMTSVTFRCCLKTIPHIIILSSRHESDIPSLPGRQVSSLNRGTPGHMRLPHRLQGQKVKSQGHGAGAYCGGHLATQLVYFYIHVLCTVSDIQYKSSVWLERVHELTTLATLYRPDPISMTKKQKYKANSSKSIFHIRNYARTQLPVIKQH